MRARFFHCLYSAFGVVLSHTWFTEYLLIKSITAQQAFKEIREVKEELWGGEFWTDGYYIATISGRGDRKVIEKYIKKRGREEDMEQLKLFEI